MSMLSDLGECLLDRQRKRCSNKNRQVTEKDDRYLLYCKECDLITGIVFKQGVGQ